VAIAPLAASVGLRWLVLPRLTLQPTLLTVCVVGMALAEACCLLGLFLFPVQAQTLFVLAVLGILQYCPLLMNDVFDRDA
jgi:hypothetical protein